MATAAAVVGVLVGVLALVGGAAQAVKAIWRAAGTSHDLISAVKDNTSATAGLAEELRTLRVDVTGELADHAARITRLELTR
jgi:hypothetical protein